LQPNNVVNCVFTPLITSIVSGSLECMKLLIKVLHCIVFCPCHAWSANLPEF
jgi:hypothetical protein